jgi:hypothetical protein
MTLESIVAKHGGALFLPYRMDAAWQDSAGTTPAVVDMPIGKGGDLGPSGYHVTQSGSARPTLRTSDGLYWWAYDAVDDLLVGAAGSYAIGATHYLAAAIKKGTSNNVTMFQVYQQSTVYSRLQNTSSNNAMSVYRTAAGINSATSGSGAFTVGSTKVIDGLQKPGYVDLGINGTITVGSSTSQSSHTVTGAIEIGNAAVGMDFYGGIMLKGEPTAEERAFIQQGLAALAGITI